MKKLVRAVALFLVVFLVFALCSCQKKGNSSFDLSDEYYSIYDEDDTNADSIVTENNGNKSSGNKKNVNNNNDSSKTKSDAPISIDIQKADGFMAKEIPSRSKAYKLSNTYKKLQSGETVNVVYFGGSVTGGTGSSNSSKYSWRALTTAYLKSVAAGQVKETNAALGGTGSYLGAARFENDVLANNPDLLFIEFAINDRYSDISLLQSKMNIEYMITKLYAQNPYADIVLVLVTNESLFGAKYPSYQAHQEIADHYNIPIVDFGCELYNTLHGSKEEFKKVLSDSVHPNDAGYKLYADIMIGALKELLVSAPLAAHTLPSSKLCSNGFSGLKNHYPSEISVSGWVQKWWFDSSDYEKDGSQFRSSQTLKKQYSRYIAPEKAGNTLTFNFTGNTFGILGTIKEGCTLEIVLDGTTKATLSGTPKPELLEYPVFENIANTSHTVTITPKGTPYTAIAAFITTA